MTSNRPYINKKSAELAALFEDNRDNPKVLQLLLSELKHRKRPKAIKLKKSVELALEGKAVSGSGSNKKKKGKFGKVRKEEVRKADLVIDENSEANDSYDVIDDPNSDAPDFDEFSSSSDEKPYHTFTQIEPCGCEGKPEKWALPSKETYQADFNPKTPLTQIFSSCLDFYINELKRNNSNAKKIQLENGNRVDLSERDNTYQFPFDEEIDVFEGASLKIECYGKSSPGRIVSVLPKAIILGFDESFGDKINTCTIIIDNTALLSTLEKRFEEIQNHQLTVPFNNQLADSLINCNLEEAPPMPSSSIQTFLPKEHSLSESQTNAILRALANDVFLIWGPPGTGKTVVLSVLVQYLVSQNKKILICSNTNQAVDQVLLKLCTGITEKVKIEASSLLSLGKVIRVGQIAHMELNAQYYDYITPDGITKRKKKEYEPLLKELERKLETIIPELERHTAIKQKFDKHSNLESILNEHEGLTRNLDTELLRIEGKENTLKDSIPQLETRLTSLIRKREESFWNRLFSQSPENLQAKIDDEKNQLEITLKSKDQLKAKIREQKKRTERFRHQVEQSGRDLLDYNLEETKIQIEKLEHSKNEADNKIDDINKELKKLASEVLKSAQVVGATITKAYLSYSDFGDYDVVIIDEASMALLPSLYFISGLAKEKVIVSGDFRQLPPIMTSKQSTIKKYLGQDVFTYAGIPNRIDKREAVPCLQLLDTQYRMTHKICSLIDQRVYSGQLNTGKKLDNKIEEKLPLLDDSLCIVDSSSLYPGCSKDSFKSKFNLIHSLLVRNLVSYFSENDSVQSEDSLGIITPYRSHSQLIRSILKADKLIERVQVGTVHRYQGDEKDTMIIDIPDSFPEWSAGYFLQADSNDEDGTKLLNVAITRAKNRIVFVANLTWLNSKLPSNSTTRYVLNKAQNLGKIIPAQDIVSLRPITRDLEHFNKTIEFDFNSVNSDGFYTQENFDKAASVDIANAKKSITIFSPFITLGRASHYELLIRKKIAEGTEVKCIIRSPRNNGSIPLENGRSAVRLLEELGCNIEYRWNSHQKVMIIDSKIVWNGSLNILSTTNVTGELMMRFESKELADHILSILTPKEINDYIKINKDLKCRKCSAKVVYRSGKYGPYLECDSLCGWTSNLSRIRKEFIENSHHSKSLAKKANKNSSVKSSSATPKKKSISTKCPKCGASMQFRSGPHGKFLGCTKYPKCKGTKSLKARQ